MQVYSANYKLPDSSSPPQGLAVVGVRSQSVLVALEATPVGGLEKGQGCVYLAWQNIVETQGSFDVEASVAVVVTVFARCALPPGWLVDADVDDASR